jgi:hypothetical protein
MKLKVFLALSLIFVISFLIRVWFLPVGALTLGYPQSFQLLAS